MTEFVWNCFWLFAVDFIYSSATLGFKFWLLTWTESFKVYSTLKCIQDTTFHHCWQHVKSYRPLQSTKASIIGFITMCIHMEEVKDCLPSTWISRFSTNDESKNFLSCSKNIFYWTPELFHILLYSKNRQKSSLESVIVADMKHRAKYTTCCTWGVIYLICMAVLVQMVIFLNRGVLCLQVLAYFSHLQSLWKHYSLWILLYLCHVDLGKTCWQ